MNDSEKISGKKIFNLLEQLKGNHTILNIHVMGTDFDGLTIILGVSDGENQRFFIDYPGRSYSNAVFTKGKKCYFEFSDSEKIHYSFKTTIDRIFGRRIKFNFPEFIERVQRRKVFRIPTPSGTRLTYSHRSGKFEFDIINISETGLLATLKNIHLGEHIFLKGSKLDKLVLILEQEDMSVNVNIKSAEIVRLEKVTEEDRVNYGLKYDDISKEGRDELKRFIYYCQRRILKKRGGLDD